MRLLASFVRLGARKMRRAVAAAPQACGVVESTALLAFERSVIAPVASVWMQNLSLLTFVRRSFHERVVVFDQLYISRVPLLASGLGLQASGCTGSRADHRRGTFRLVGE